MVLDEVPIQPLQLLSYNAAEVLQPSQECFAA